jgi:hypothetical protein
MLYVVIVILCALLGFAIWRAKANPQQGLAFPMVMAVLVHITSAIAVFKALRTEPAPQIPVGWYESLGIVLGEQVTKLVPAGGKVLVFITPEATANHQESMREERTQHLRGRFGPYCLVDRDRRSDEN